MSSSADIAIYGGAAGGGKTYALLLEPLRHVHNSDFGAVIFRRTYKQVTREGGMWDESGKLYPHLNAVGTQTALSWRFPSGARVSFAHMQREDDKYEYKGAQIPLLCFDQLEDFSENQFFYLLSRNRSTCGIRPYVRGTCNPNPDSWLRHFLAWWIADDGYADLSREGILRYFVRVGDRLEWADTSQQLTSAFPGVMPKSVTFIPSSIYDNPALMTADPTYMANLLALLPVERARLLGDKDRGGNWNVREEAGTIFNRAWFRIVEAAPTGGIDCRFWDLAATRKELAKGDPDYTSGVLIRRAPNRRFYVLDCFCERVGPTEADNIVLNMASQDKANAMAQGASYKVRWEREPGASGKRDSTRLALMLAAYDCGGIPPQGDKIQRARPFAAQCQAGNVDLVAGPWVESWLRHMHNQPAAHDDIMDASSGSYNCLASGVWTRGPAK